MQIRPATSVHNQLIQATCTQATTVRILLATNHLWSNTGSELTLLGFARALSAKGHDIACFSLMKSPKMAHEMQLDGLRLLKLDELTQFNPSVVYCQHHTTATAVRGCLSAVPIFLAHLGVEPELEQAPFVDCNIYRHLAISEEVRESLIEQGIWRWRIRVFRNAVPAENFLFNFTLPKTRDKALLFSYKLSQAQRSVIREAVAKEGLQLDDHSMIACGQLPYKGIGAYLYTARVVLASGRSAIEAMMTGTPTVVVGPKGLDGAATPYRLDELAKANFSGRFTAREITVESVHESIVQALSVDTQLIRSIAIKRFDVSQRSAELEHMCVRAAHNRRKQMKPRNLARVSRFGRFLEDHSKMAIRQVTLDQQSWSSGRDWKLPIASEFIRMVAPALGFYPDFWTEAHFSALLLSERGLCGGTLELWLKPDSSTDVAQFFVKIDGVERTSAKLNLGQLNAIKFPIDVAAGTVFELAVVCDYVKPVELPDERRLSYILKSLRFA